MRYFRNKSEMRSRIMTTNDYFVLSRIYSTNLSIYYYYLKLRNKIKLNDEDFRSSILRYIFRII